MITKLSKIFSKSSTTSTTSTASSPSNSISPSNNISPSNDSIKNSIPPPIDEKEPSYKEGHYFNYFRKLEIYNEEQVFRNKNCLLPKINQNSAHKNTFHLKDLKVVTQIRDTTTITEFTHKYENENSNPVEAIFLFPLPTHSTISDFTIKFDDKVMKAKIKEIKKAEENYSDAIASGGQAFLGRKTEDNFFEINLGNIPPSKSVEIQFSMISEIGTIDDSFLFCLHKYMFPSGSYPFTIETTVNLSTNIDSVEVMNLNPEMYNIDTNKNTSVIKVIETNAVGVQNNFVISIKPEKTNIPESFIEDSIQFPDTYAVGLNFYPNFDSIPADEINQKSEFIFVVDCSGSMCGKRIENAKKALEICLRSLNENVKFNIYRFGSDFEKLFPTSKAYDDETLNQASNYVLQTRASLGGTRLFPPIKDILSQTYDAEYPRQIMIFTDGAISNRDEFISYCARQSSTTRIFTYGIGGGVDKELVVGLGAACMGQYRMISDNCPDMEKIVLSLLSIAMEPTFSNIKVDWNPSNINGLSVTSTPKIIRPVYSRERLSLYGLIEKKSLNDLKKIEILLTGNGPTGSLLTFPITLDFNNSQKSNLNPLHLITGFNIINDLEIEQSRFEKQNDPIQLTNDDTDKIKINNNNNLIDVKNDIIKYSKNFNLVSNYSSFIVTSESDQVTTDTMTPIVVSPNPSRLESEYTEKNRKISKMKKYVKKSSSSSTKDKKKKEKECEEDSDKGSYVSPSMSSTPPPKTGNVLLDLISSQKANGSWAETVLPFKIPDTPQSLVGLPIEIWVTLLVIAKITKEFASDESIWELVVQKAKKYVKSQLLKANKSDKFGELTALSNSIN